MDNEPVLNPRPLWARIFVSPDEPRLRAGWRIVGQLMLLLFFALLISFLVTTLSELVPALSFLTEGYLLSFLYITLSVVFARRWFDKRSFASLGLKLEAAALKDLLVGFGIAAAMMAAIFLVHLVFGWVSVLGFAWQEHTPRVLAELVGYWLLAFAATGWTEELVFRGYYLRNLSEGLSPLVAAILTSLLFALAHVQNPGLGPIPGMGLFLAGLFFVFATQRSGGLWLPIGIHFGWNLFEGTVFGFPVSGLNVTPLILTQVRGPEILTGSGFGPEAGVILVPALALAAGFIWLYTRSKFPER